MRMLLILLMCFPGYSFAASGGGKGVPTPTQTTKSCWGVRVWDDKAKRCVRPKKSSLDSDQLYGAVRELAYAGRFQDAQGVLRAMVDQSDDRVLTYWGFTHRKLGNIALANAFYNQAIAQNPNNILARSYMGQGFVEDDRPAQALAQWRQIRARGGIGTWAELSLRAALETGQGFSY